MSIETLITPEGIAAEIANRKTEIINSICNNLQEKLGNSIEWELQSQISKEVSTIVKEQMLEEIKAAIVASKPQILEQINLACASVAAEVGTAMVKKAASNMDGYAAGDIIKKVFGIY